MSVRRPSTSAAYLGVRGQKARPLAGCAYLGSGKVRDLYALDEQHLLFVTTDRISAFDVVMREAVPGKGRVLTAIAAHWFEHTREIVENHLISTAVEDLPAATAAERDLLRGRIMVVRRTQPTPVEWVVRGFLAGSGFKSYQATGTLFGEPMPRGLRLCERLPRTVLTPTTKANAHDVPLALEAARAAVGDAVFERASSAAFALYAFAAEQLAARGILLADTKFEFGLGNGRILLIDESLTPDSSRFWPAAQYQPGTNQPSYDKQILRDYLETLAWNKEAPPPPVPREVLEHLARRYRELCRLLTGAVLPA